MVPERLESKKIRVLLPEEVRNMEGKMFMQT
jgi:hypothetical protein